MSETKEETRIWLNCAYYGKCELQAQLAALQWVKITPETMPKTGEDVLIKLKRKSMKSKVKEIFLIKWDNIFNPDEFDFYFSLPPLPDKEKSDG